MGCCPPDNIRFPLIIDDDLEEREAITHIEMYHHQGHYDVIVSAETGKICRLMPQLTGRDEHNRLNLTVIMNHVTINTSAIQFECPVCACAAGIV